MGETLPDESGCADTGRNGNAAHPQPEVNGHAVSPPSDDQLSLFFQRFPCSAEAKACLDACAPAVSCQVLHEFQPDALGQSDYSRPLLSFIDEVQCGRSQPQGPPQPEEKEPGNVEELLAAFAEKYCLDTAALETLDALPEEVLQDVLEGYSPYSQRADHSRLVASYAKKVLRQGRASSRQEWRTAVPVGVGVAEPEYRDALLECQVAGRWEQALDLWGQLRCAGLISEVGTANAALGACRRGGQWEHALALLDQMPELHLAPDALSFRHVAAACSEAGQWARAATLLDEMRQSGAPLSSSDAAVRDAFAACEKSRQWHYALALLAEIRSSGSEASAANLRSAMAACEKAGRWEHCMRLWRELRTGDITPDVGHCRSALQACVKGRQWQAALSVLKLMWETMEEEAQPAFFEQVMSCCRENQKWDTALGLLHRMLTVGPAPDRACYSATIAACAKGRAETTRWEWALLLLAHMSRREVGATARVGAAPSGNTFGEVMSACMKSRKWEICLALFTTMKDSGLAPTYVCKHAAMRACESSAKWETALAVFENHMQEITERKDPEWLDPGVESLLCNCLINAFERAGQLPSLHDAVFARLQRLGVEVLEKSLGEWAVMDQRRPLRARRAGGSAREGATVIGYAHMAFTRLCSLDVQPAPALERWRRTVQRTMEGRLRDLHPLAHRWGSLPHPGVEEEQVCSMNDFAHRFTGDVLSRAGMQCLPLPEKSPRTAALHRSIWWDIDRLPPDPEGWFVVAMFQYNIRLGTNLPRLRSPGKMAVYCNKLLSQTALTPVRMMQDRMQHRGWHAERTALLGLSFRMLQRYAKLGEEEGWPTGPVHLHVNHTPCMSCMAVIAQFQGRFPGLGFSVTFDVWWDLRAQQQDPWDPRWPRWPPLLSPPPPPPEPPAAEPAAERPENGEGLAPGQPPPPAPAAAEGPAGGEAAGERPLEDPWDLRWPRWPPLLSPPSPPPEPPAAERLANGDGQVARQPPPPAPAAAEGPDGGEAPGERPLEERLADFRARFPMSDRVFAVLGSSPREVQEMVMDAFREDGGGGPEDFSKQVMQTVVQLRRQWSAAPQQQPVEEEVA